MTFCVINKPRFDRAERGDKFDILAGTHWSYAPKGQPGEHMYWSIIHERFSELPTYQKNINGPY